MNLGLAVFVFVSVKGIFKYWIEFGPELDSIDSIVLVIIYVVLFN